MSSTFTRLFLGALLVTPCAALSQQDKSASDLPVAPRPAAYLISSTSGPADISPASSDQSSSSDKSSSAQSSSTTPQTQTAAPDTQTEAQRELKQQESQRMLGVVPAFNEVMNGHAAPLSPKQKFSLFLHGAVDPFQFFIVGVDAGLEQAEDQFPEYHYGAVGFAKRYGAAYADDFDGNFFGNAVLPSLLHQDPRYFRLGHGSVMHRILYAAATTVIAHGDNGKWQPNYSNVIGNFIGGAISNAYYPAADRGFSLTIQRGATVTAEGAIGSFAEEFYPDLAAWWHNRHSPKIVPPAPAPAPNVP